MKNTAHKRWNTVSRLLTCYANYGKWWSSNCITWPTNCQKCCDFISYIMAGMWLICVTTKGQKYLNPPAIRPPFRKILFFRCTDLNHLKCKNSLTCSVGQASLFEICRYLETEATWKFHLVCRIKRVEPNKPVTKGSMKNRRASGSEMSVPNDDRKKPLFTELGWFFPHLTSHSKGSQKPGTERDVPVIV